MAEGFANDAKQHGLPEALEHGAGQVAGGYIAGKIPEMGAPIERAGLGVVNNALGARGPKMFQYGQNAARGAIDEGIVPAMSKHSASMDLESKLPAVGERVSNAVTSSPATIPLRFLKSSIESPINEARGVMEGPGGGAGRNAAPLDELQGRMSRRAPNASAPIYGSNAGTRFTPQETVQAMAAPPKALPAPTEDIPLSEARPIAGKPSRPITLTGNRAMQRDFPPYGADATTRLEPGGTFVPPESQFQAPDTFGNLGPSENIGQVAGERGGMAAPKGVLRRPVDAGAVSDQPSQFLDMRHPTATPTDLWHTIRNIDENTRFNPQPEIEGMNDVRRSIRGGLSGNLKDAVPEVTAPMQTYSDLSTAREALDRTMHSGTSLKRFLDTAAFPLETTGGAALVKMGRGLSKIDPRFLQSMAVPGMAKENR
jgi:hypothetical protein